MAIIGYARVSTVGQSLDAQLIQLEKAGAEKIFQEKISGVKKDRPELQAMLDYIREGDTVIVSKLDRIARSTKHLLDIVDCLQEKKVTFSVLNINLDTSTPTGKLMLTMLGAIATFERKMMLERQAEGIEKAKQEGKYKGRKATARAKATEVRTLVKAGMAKQKIAEELGIGVASVYRILKS
ncbi:MAG TPA: recombinase family protein [Smithellaceae bacterium]|jgi:DNA invertase Pin-like site-specific DNA recombinase|uniref:DNA invertase Pin-like site-specific DNA recombinase n=1 Tax=Halanaerobium congolense TaxID=54121 RepID=A0A318E316_9FIRM|nr:MULTISPECIES: recombinase family protein [Bacteria]PXV62038.1 DNA invertase Pin-like site-specific DNA recombinase [Halanaerobium congolense]TDX37667.1 DNA invertase Pin-like site-specific DNA recombinase [Halanaerobium congolense]HOQ42610.1 recombinase family protein [Smithellaceae bacterium]